MMDARRRRQVAEDRRRGKRAREAVKRMAAAKAELKQTKKEEAA